MFPLRICIECICIHHRLLLCTYLVIHNAYYISYSTIFTNTYTLILYSHTTISYSINLFVYRDVLKSDSSMVYIPELDLELTHGTLGIHYIYYTHQAYYYEYIYIYSIEYCIIYIIYAS